jgi:chaperonin GroES
MSEKIKPFGDNVVVEIVNQEKTAGGIIIPDKAKSNQRDAIVGKVIGVGPGRLTEQGTMIKPQAKEGDYVLLSRGAGVEIELGTRTKDARRVRIMRDVELLGSIEESRIIQLGLT